MFKTKSSLFYYFNKFQSILFKYIKFLCFICVIWLSTFYFNEKRKNGLSHENFNEIFSDFDSNFYQHINNKVEFLDRLFDNLTVYLFNTSYLHFLKMNYYAVEEFHLYFLFYYHNYIDFFKLISLLDF